MNRYKQEFPNFDDDLPTIEGFFDCSWHNDSCPSIMGYYNPKTKQIDGEDEPFIQIYIEYKNPDLRDWRGIERFHVINHLDIDEDFNGQLMLSTDLWDDVLNKVKELKNG